LLSGPSVHRKGRRVCERLAGVMRERAAAWVASHASHAEPGYRGISPSARAQWMLQCLCSGGRQSGSLQQRDMCRCRVPCQCVSLAHHPRGLPIGPQGPSCVQRCGRVLPTRPGRPWRLLLPAALEHRLWDEALRAAWLVRTAAGTSPRVLPRPLTVAVSPADGCWHPQRPTSDREGASLCSVRLRGSLFAGPCPRGRRGCCPAAGCPSSPWCSRPTVGCYRYHSLLP
jgi:hypothetical protein